MKSKIAILVFWLVVSCQGPWSYYPENPENYAGIWTNAYVISGRPVEDVCFDKIHGLSEVRMPGFAFYNEASVEIAGTFSGLDTSFVLVPKTGKPNCFVGPSDLLAEAGKNYKINISIEWDSAGKKTTSNFNSETYIPQKFKIQRAYSLEGEPFAQREVIKYFPPPLDLKAAYFIPEYSNDVSGVLVSMVYSNYAYYWGENSIVKMIEQFLMDGADTAMYAKFGYREQVYFASSVEIAGNKKDIDSIPIMGINMPASGRFQLLFYATTNDYVKYRDSYLNNSNDSRVQAIYNINGGAGIFAGMLVDTFYVQTTPASSDIKLYNNFDAKSAFCRTENRQYGIHNYKANRECVEFWDSIIWCEIDSGKPSSKDIICLGDYFDPRPWNSIPEADMRKFLTMDEIITWCEHRDFPIYQYPLCGSAMVRFSKDGKSSSILDREVKKWCEEHSDDPEC